MNYLTVKEVATALNYNPRTIWEQLHKGTIPYHRVGKTNFRIPESWLKKMLEQYPTEKEYLEHKENKLLGVIDTVKPIETIEAENKIEKEVLEVAKKEANTEITVSQPKAKEFIPNPAKRKKKSTRSPSKRKKNVRQNNNNPDDNLDFSGNDPVIFSDSGNPKGFLDNYTIGGL